MKRQTGIGIVATKLVFGATLALGFGTAPHAVAESCVDDGPRVCAPGNSNGAPAGCYDDGGVLEFDWPCSPWTPDMGVRHGDGTTTYPNGDVQNDDGDFLVVGDHSHDARTN